MGIARFLAARDMRGKGRLAAQMQAGDMGHHLFGAAMMLRQIVDENRTAGAPFFQNGSNCRTFRTLIGVNLRIDAQPLLAGRCGYRGVRRADWSG